MSDIFEKRESDVVSKNQKLIAKRVTLRCGKIKRSILFCSPPFPEVGDIVDDTAGGSSWAVEKVKDEQVLAIFKAGARLRQLFP